MVSAARAMFIMDNLISFAHQSLGYLFLFATPHAVSALSTYSIIAMGCLPILYLNNTSLETVTQVLCAARL